MDTIKNKLMSKNGRVTVSLAREMLTYYEGDRIKTIGEYAETLSTGRGTVQAAMRFLQTAGAIELESRGHLGTTITALDYKRLWDIADLGVVMGVMPLPYSKRYEGLATGLYKAFEKANIPFSLAFMRGAAKRIEALKFERYNFAIISKLAAGIEIQRTPALQVIHEFQEGSYVGNHGVIFRNGSADRIENGMRIAIDSSSIDQMVLTRYECEGKEVEFLETPYTQILQKLENNEIDAAIWNSDEITEKHLKFKISPLTSAQGKALNHSDTMAVIVANKAHRELEGILKRFINMNEIEEIQKRVCNKEIIPSY